VSMITLDFGQPPRAEVDGIVVHKTFRPREGIPALRFVHPRLTATWRALREVEELMRGLNEAASRLESGARELDEKDRYLEALLRTSPLGLVLVDAKNRVRWTSRRLREFLGDSKQDLKQMPFEEFFADASELAAFRDGMERKGRVRELIARIRRRDGSEFRARLDSAYVERSAERLAAVWVQAFGLHAQKPDAPAPETGA